MDNNKGEILCWGCGEFGQHGHGNTANIGPGDSLVPNWNERPDFGETQSSGELLLAGSLKWRLKVFDCGASHTVVVTDKDEVYSWGNGNSGQLGCGDKKTHLTPQRVRLPSEGRSSPIRGIACGSRHTVIWLENGLCFSWGNNFYAQLGYDFRLENYKDNQMTREFLLQHLARKTICDEVLPHLLRPIAHMKVNRVACGEKHTLFLYNTGMVAACGCNNFGQLGTGSRTELVSPKSLDSLEGVVFITCGANHSMAITADGELFTWGLGRACGYRREDVLFPVRKMTRRSNVVAAAGGSSHSLALTGWTIWIQSTGHDHANHWYPSANGTLYTWGGGTEGQLGHGSNVLYLCNPKPLSHDALPRASQIACGDSYSAAVTSDGILYMWGQNNHVIPTSSNNDPSHKQFVPKQVSPGGNRVANIVCGSWHAMAVTGTPDWQPLEEDSEEEKGDDTCSIISSAVDEMSESGQAHASVGAYSPELFPEETVYHKMTKPTNHRIQRETTKLTLAEFYAPTPIPTASSMEELVPGIDSDQDDEEVEKEPLPDSGKEPSIIEERLKSEPKEQKLSDEMESAETVNAIGVEPSTEPDLTSSAGETLATPAAKNKSEHDESAAKVHVPETGHGKEKAQRHSDKQNRSNESKMVRSKTMPVVNRKPLKMTPAASTVSGSDWSELSKLSSSSVPEKDKFVIQKHVSVHSNRSRNGSGDKAVKRNLVTHVGLHSSGKGERPLVESAADQKSLPQLPKFNRAKTFYGQMKHKRGDPEPKMSQFLYTLPSAAPSATPSAVPSSQTPFSNQRSHQRVLLKKPAGSSENSPNHTKTNLDGTPSIPELKSQQPRKPVFSSAASWRSRYKDNAIL